MGVTDGHTDRAVIAGSRASMHIAGGVDAAVQPGNRAGLIVVGPSLT
jgi:hypothetical protein